MSSTLEFDFGFLVGGLLTFGFLYGNYVTWEAHFGKNRVPRHHKASPSYGAPPKLTSTSEFKQINMERANKHPEAFHDIDTYKPDPPYPHKVLKKAQDSDKSVAISSESDKLLDSTNGGVVYGQPDDDAIPAPRFDMDHQYLSFGQYLWTQFSVGPSAMALWLKGVARLIYRTYAEKRGWIEAKPLDAAAVVSNLLLESAISIHYRGKKQDEDGNLIATFIFPDFPLIDQTTGDFQTADLLQVNIDLEKKRMVSANLDGRELKAKEAIILLFHYTISTFHVKLHSYANWGLNLEEEQKKKNPIPFRSALVTIIYNYFGFTSYTTFFPFWRAIGVISKQFQEDTWNSTAIHGVSLGSICHPDIYDLMPYSKFVYFTCKLKPFFLKEFAKDGKKYFPKCYGDALFYGTCIHSLDHCHMNWNIEDVLWLDVDHPDFGLMAEMGRVIKVGFVSDIPGLLFDRHYKDFEGKYPFYDRIYKKAKELNPFLADHMDVCIVK